MKNQTQNTDKKKELQDKCIKELKEYYSIKDRVGKHWMDKSKEIHIINKEWLKNWKEYVNKYYLTIKYNLHPTGFNKGGESPSKTFLIKSNPGPINNSQILLNINDFYNDGDINNIDNIVISSKINYKQIKYISDEIWEFFLEKYGGSPEIKVNIIKNKETNTEELELVKRNVNLFFLPDKEKIIGNDNLIENYFKNERLLPMYLKNDNKLIDVRNKIIEIEKKRKLHIKDENFDKNSFKLWLVSKDNLEINDLKNIMIMFYGEKTLKKEQNKLKLLDQKLNTNALFNFFPKYLSNNEDNEYLYNLGFESNNEDIMFVEIINNINYNYFQNYEEPEGICDKCKKKKILSFKCSCNKKKYCSEECKINDFSSHFKNCSENCLESCELKRTEISRLGLCGLKNLGNTCYMNTALQCLSSYWILTNYFLRDIYKDFINIQNPLGHKGILCKSYAIVLKHLYQDFKNVYVPKNFKLILENLNDLYKGKEQQDAQEFLNFLLDGLHEDLNKCKEKNLTAIENEIILTNDTQAEIEWLNFLNLNQSLIVDLFYGQFMTKSVCQTCDTQNVRFEPFLNISLSIEDNKNSNYNIRCFFLFYDMNLKNIKFTLTFQSDYTIMALRNKVAKLLNIHPMSFLIFVLKDNSSLEKIINSEELISIISNDKKSNSSSFFLIQLEPKIFYNRNLNMYINQDYNSNNYYKNSNDFQNIFKNKQAFYDCLNDYSENENKIINTKSKFYYQDKLKIRDINEINYGFSKDEYLMTLLFLKKISNNLVIKDLFFPKVFMLEKNITFKKIHEKIFEYFRQIINLTESFNKYFNILFQNNNNLNINDDNIIEILEKYNIPYIIKFKNIYYEKNKNNKCILCNKNNCESCVLPYNNMTLAELINKFPKNNKGQTIDNSYYFLNPEDRKGINNYDFRLEMIFEKSIGERFYQSYNNFEDFKLIKRIPSKKENTNLYKCFQYFSKWEFYESQNSFECNTCKRKQKSKRKMEIYRCPHYLIIHLKRFNADNKIETLVDFPIKNLDLHKYINNTENLECIYNLIGVINHKGSLQEYGHYYAFVKNPIKKKWYKIDDSNVTTLKTSEIVNQNAYVLFYERKDLENMLDIEELYQKKLINYTQTIKELIKNDRNSNK